MPRRGDATQPNILVHVATGCAGGVRTLLYEVRGGGHSRWAAMTGPCFGCSATGRRRVKGSVDIEMTVDMLDLTPLLDHVVIFFGGGDLRRLVESVQRCGVRVTVISTIRTQPAMIADGLRRQADAFIDLAEHITRNQVEPRQRAALAGVRLAPGHSTPAELFRNTPDLPNDRRRSERRVSYHVGMLGIIFRLNEAARSLPVLIRTTLGTAVLFPEGVGTLTDPGLEILFSVRHGLSFSDDITGR